MDGYDPAIGMLLIFYGGMVMRTESKGMAWRRLFLIFAAVMVLLAGGMGSLPSYAEDEEITDDEGAGDDSGSGEGTDDSGSEEGTDDSGSGEETPADGPAAGKFLAIGKKLYKVRVKNKELTLCTAVKSGTLRIPATETIGGITYKVTQVGQESPVLDKAVKKVIVGKNVKKIARNAFNIKARLKITINGSMTAGSIGKNAFRQLKKGTVVSLKNATSNVRTMIRLQNKKIKVKYI